MEQLTYRHKKTLCCSCNNSCSEAHNCSICELPCHAIAPCSVSTGEEGFGAKVICQFCYQVNSDEINDQNQNTVAVAETVRSNDVNVVIVTDHLDEEENEQASVVNSRKRLAYSIKEKLEILEYASSTSIHEAARRYKVSRGSVQDWKKQEPLLRKNVKSAKRIAGGGRHLKNASFDESIAIWIKQLRAKKLRVTSKMIITKAMEESQQYPELSDFSSWMVPKIYPSAQFVVSKANIRSTKTPRGICRHDHTLYYLCAEIVGKNNYTHVYACDETAVWLDPEGGKCVSEKGARTVTVLSTGHEKARVTVLLTARSDGTKLRPFVLLPRKRPLPEVEKRFKNKLVLAWCGRNWMDNALTEKYLEQIFGSFYFGQRLLIWDSFRCHISEDTKKTLKRLNIHSAVIPGGTTKYIQPPDVSWNAPFKKHIQDLHTDWMVHGEKPTTSTGNLKAPGIEIYLGWIETAWEKISTELIANSFTACGIRKEGDDVNLDEKIHVFDPVVGAIPNGLGMLRQRRKELEQEADFPNLPNLMEEIDLSQDESDYSVEF